MNTTTAQQSGVSDAAIAQAFREMANAGGTFKQVYSSLFDRANKIEAARQLQAAGGEGAVAYQTRISTGLWRECEFEEYDRVSHNRPHDARKLYAHHSPPAGGFVVDAELVRDIDAALAAEDAALGFEQTAIVLRRCRDALTASPTAQPSAKDGVRGDATEFPEDFAHWWNYSPWSDASRWKEGYREVAYSAWLAAKATTASGLVDGLPAKWRETARIEMTFDSVEHKERAYALRKAADELEAAIDREVVE